MSSLPPSGFGPPVTGPGPGAQQPSSGKAMASLILGIAGIFVVPLICSILAIVYGNQAKREIAASGGTMSGDGLAKAGVILGWVGIGLIVVGIVLGLVFVVAVS